MAISGGTSVAIRHPIAGNLFADPAVPTMTAGNDRVTFFQGDDTRFSFTRASTGTKLAQDGFLATDAVDAFRFDFDPLDSSSLSSGGWLCERASTNLHTRSEEIGDADWTLTGCTITDDTDVAPDGATTMDTIREDASTGAKHSGYPTHAGITMDVPAVTGGDAR